MNTELTESIRNKNRSRLYLLEFAVILFNFSTFLPTNLLLNQFLKQACFNFGYEKSICDVISQNGNSTTSVEEELQPTVANINLILNLLHGSVPAVLQLFLGPWSDKYGRKKVMNFVSIGFVLTLTSTAAVCYYSDYIQPLSPWIYVVCCIPMNFFGGFQSISTATLCYITDIHEESKRSYHFTLIEIMIVCTFFLGALACSAILSISNALTVFITAALCAIIAAIIIIVFIDESVESIESSSTCESIKNIFTTTHIRDMINTCFKPRVFYDRGILFSLVAIITFNRFARDGTFNVSYLFERIQLGWTIDDHNYYEATSIVLNVIGIIFVMIVLKRFLGLSEIILISLAVFSFFLDYLLKAFAIYSWQMYAISVITLMKCIAPPLCRSMISSVVSHNEIGKAMSFTTTFESIANSIAMPIFVTVYEATFQSFAGAFYLISAFACLINIFIAFTVIIMKNISGQNREKYQEIN